MKEYIYKRILLLFVVSLGLVSCEDFLDRPTEDSYTISGFYQNDAQLFQAVNPIYNSPWHDFSRAFFRLAECFSGNYYCGISEWDNIAMTSSNEDLSGMSASLWSVNAYCNSLIENINLYAGPETTEAGRNTAKGEALVWKSMAYFYMVRIWGAVPIIHNNSEMISAGDYNSVYKAKVENIYDYIIMTLEQAISWLPEKNLPGRIDRYVAYGLLSKVYLTKAGYGMSGSRNQADLDMAAEYARKVIEESGRELMPNYPDIFRLANNISDESLLAWRWVIASHWTASNPMQPDLCLSGFDDYSGWGGWQGPSIDLQDAFGEDALNLATRQNRDSRRKATMMLYGDVYEYFWQDKGGFDWAAFQTNNGSFDSPTGSNAVKHLFGTSYDHEVGTGVGVSEQMKSSLATHLLRLADVYLIYAEAVLGNGSSTSDAKALNAFNAVRTRAGLEAKSSITFDDIWNERRLELACEGDRWYDFVRLHYYNPEKAINILKGQRRKTWSGINDYYKTGINGNFTVGDDGLTYPRYNDTMSDLNITHDKFECPFPEVDLAMNPNLREEPVDHDISVYTY